jgi:hypothetical protein
MPILMVLGVVGLIVFAFLQMSWHYSTSQKNLDDWAAKSGFELISAERRSFRRGPFFFFTSEDQEVYRITVRDQDGQTREGYARTGGWILGQLSDRVEVEWD